MAVNKSQFDADLAAAQTAQGATQTKYTGLSGIVQKAIAEINALIAIINANVNIDYTSEDTIATGITAAATSVNSTIDSDTAALNTAIAAAAVVTGS